MTGLENKLFGPEGLATPLEIIAVLTALSLLPAILLTVTSFVRTIVVLSFIRQGIGSQETPPNQVLIGLAMFLTLFVMTPVMNEMKATALDPYLAGNLTEAKAFETALVPLRSFMLRHTRQAEGRVRRERHPLASHTADRRRRRLRRLESARIRLLGRVELALLERDLAEVKPRQPL